MINENTLNQIFEKATKQGDIKYIFDYKGKTYFIEWNKLKWSNPVEIKRLKLC